jgi:hypothetical protein
MWRSTPLISPMPGQAWGKKEQELLVFKAMSSIFAMAEEHFSLDIKELFILCSIIMSSLTPQLHLSIGMSSD